MSPPGPNAAHIHNSPTISPALSWPRRVLLVAGDIKLAHSVFALPFAILAAFLARPSSAPWSRFAAQLALIIVCMVLARTWAMLVNRIADRRFDAANPRTARRVLASGRLGVRDAIVIAALCAAGFLLACAGFWLFFDNRWPLLLGVPVLAWVAFYSFTKRFTAACHLFLGGALAISPLAAAIAINPEALGVTPALWWLAAMVLLWVAGFDVIYSLQDFEFDLAHRLHSIPSYLGSHGAIWCSRVLHTAALAMLVLAARFDPRFGWVFWTGVVMVAGLLVLEHAILARRGKAGLNMAFFTVNGLVSCLLGVLGVIDLTAA